MGFPLYIARRYLFSLSNNNAINIITAIAAMGVVIGAASLLVVLSGFAGLKDYTLAFSSFVDPDLKVSPAKGKTLQLNDQIIAALEKNNDIASFSQVIEEKVILGFEDKNEAVLLKGIDDSYPARTIDSILSRGQWLDQESNQIVSGWGVASNLSFGIFDFNKTIKIYVPKPGKGQISSVRGAFNSVSAINSGVFEINENLDYSMIYANIEMARFLLNYDESTVSALEISLNPNSNPEEVSEFLEGLFKEAVVIKNRVQLNDSLYKMLNTENLAVYLIFTLVMIIALFNVIGSIIMMILDKKKNLGTLYNLGATVPEIRKIFFLQGSLMVILGGLSGVVLGSLLVWIQEVTGFVPITPSLAYPVKLTIPNVLLVIATICLLGILSSWIASRRINSQLIKSI